MTGMTRYAALAISGLFLAACAGEVDFDAIEARPKPASEFHRSLAEAYLGYARTEAAEFDRADARLFADKAEAALAGEAVMPSLVEERDITPEDAADLNKARGELIQSISAAGRTLAPKEIARAQAAFDCWLQEQEEGHQPDDIAACRESFETALAAAGEKLNAMLVVLLDQEGGKTGAVVVQSGGQELLLDKARQAGSVSAGKTPESAGELSDDEIGILFGRALAAVPEAPLYYTLYFREGSNELTDESAASIRGILDTIANRTVPDISVIGHSDRVGNAPANARLSLVRANSVAEMLFARGLSRDIVEITSFGETDNAVPTADGVAEPLNRRVEISVR